MGRERSSRSSGRIRIIGGRWRGRRIPVPDVAGLRPTPDRVRETLFNWLAPHLEGARVLDLFAGSGILGFEALSRGAASVTMVERHRQTAAALAAAAGELGAEASCEVVVSDAEKFLRNPRRAPFDLACLDPPHPTTDYDALCNRLDASGLVRSGGLIYVEHSGRRATSFRPPDNWTLHREGAAGDVAYQLWRRDPPRSD